MQTAGGTVMKLEFETLGVYPKKVVCILKKKWEIK